MSSPKSDRRQATPKPPISPNTALSILLFARSLSALYAPIQDCDEVFNYWEPTHYLSHGSGLQTWEYSPDYAIRSWAYTGLHAVVTSAARMIPLSSGSGSGSDKVLAFYVLRSALAFLCATCEARLFNAISQTLHPRVALYFLFAMVFSPGMFHASAAYLPSSFAMYATMLAMAAFMNWKGGLRTAEGIFWTAVGGLLGWPFAMAMAVPFLLEEVLMAGVTGDASGTLTRLVYGSTRAVLVLVFQMVVDSLFYKKIVCVPFNIVRYNIFSSASRGPNIYGTEPWHFYVRNLLLNFNIWFLLALISIPLLLLLSLQTNRRTPPVRQTTLRTFFFLCPFYLWLAIFTLQPHKEERFMYPAYPALALNASLSLHHLLHLLTTSPIRILPPRLKAPLTATLLLLSANLSLLRTLGTTTAYAAPLSILLPLTQQAHLVRPTDHTLCLAKEWYRYPSSFFLPPHMRTRFIRSEFKGLLPGAFSEASHGFGTFPGAWLVPSGMNDENREDPGKYVDVAQCSFLVDSSFDEDDGGDGGISGGEGRKKGKKTRTTALEPDYAADDRTWEKVRCEPFLDAARSGVLARLLWVPDAVGAQLPRAFRREWGRYCLLRRRKPSH